MNILRLSATLAALTILPIEAGPEEKSPILDLTAVSPAGLSFSFEIAEPVTLFDTRRAQRRLDTLPEGQALLILGLDRFGLQVKGTGKNGPLTGWVSQRRAFANDSAKLDQVASFYDRQLQIERLVAARTPAIGMTLHEVSRILGPATNHNIEALDGKRSETVQWLRTEKVDLNDTLDLGTNAAILKVDVETGRVTIQFVDGVATSLALNLEGAPNNAIPTVPKPVALPFAARPTPALAGAAPAAR